jgi:hypothetical protein
LNWDGFKIDLVRFKLRLFEKSEKSCKLPDMVENGPYNWQESFSGNWDLYKTAIQNPKTIHVYDIDGILAYSAKVVFEDFTNKTGIYVHPADIDKFNFLRSVAKNHGLNGSDLASANDGWYDPEILLKAPRYLYIKSVVQRSLSLVGAERNFVLTARNPELKQATLEWFDREFPEIRPDNIIIRDTKTIDAIPFKIEKLNNFSKLAPWVVYTEDALQFVEAALAADISNLVVVNIPQGTIWPGFRHNNLLLLKRFTVKNQAMYPFHDTITRAANNT